MIKPFRCSCFCLIVLSLVSLGACNSSDQAYIQKINRWHQKRITSLKEDDSWLSLAGLFPLHQGAQTFGADSSNDIVFPPGKAPDRMGSFFVEGDQIRVGVRDGVSVLHDSSDVQEIEMQSDMSEDLTVLSYGSLRWYVIERGGKFFVRLKDTEHPRLEAFKGIERFPVSKKWRIEATYHEFETPDSLEIPNILGQVKKYPLYGILKFTIDGEEYSLAPLGNPGSDELFIVFGDETNGTTTYGGGRFIYAEMPGSDGTTFIDFNKAYNPPCAFTPFATCPLPPSQNELHIKITAGEKKYGEGHGAVTS